MKDQEQNIFANIDWKIVIAYVFLVCFGWMNIYSAVYDESGAAVMDFSRQHGKQFIWIIVAFVTAIFTLIIDSRYFRLQHILYMVPYLFCW